MAVSEQNWREDLDRAKAFFERAEAAAGIDNFDYAIEMFLQGLRYAPDAVGEGHKPLHHTALVRQAKGGKKPSLSEKLKHSRGKTALEQMLNAEYLFAKDPDNQQYAEALMRSAAGLGCRQTTEWIADLLFQAYRASPKPSAVAYVRLKDAYAEVGLFEKALAACQHAASLRPDNDALKDELRDLSAQLTVQKGRYEEQGDFRVSIKDRDQQQKLQDQERIVKTRQYRLAALADARQGYQQNPQSAINIFKLADALADMEEDEPENEATELLDKTYAATGDFSFKRRCGELRLRQMRRQIRHLQAQLEEQPADSQSKNCLEALTDEMARFELEQLRLCVENYPTDLRAKYEYGVCLMQNNRYDDAIPFFQEARKDPRHTATALNRMGMCFLAKEWMEDAVDIFGQAIKAHEIPDDAVGKELRYNLGRSYEQLGRVQEALDLYRKIAQVDYAFKDVRQRVDKLRKAADRSDSQSQSQ